MMQQSSAKRNNHMFLSAGTAAVSLNKVWVDGETVLGTFNGDNFAFKNMNKN